MKKKLCILLSILIFVFTLSVTGVFASSYLADKTELPVDLEVSGAEALCQTDDGYVWIAQYSGLTRYDSKEFVTYKEFTENDVKYNIINVRDLATKDNVLYIATSANLFKYEKNTFHNLNVNAEIIKDIELDKESEIIYVSTIDQGLLAYDIKTDSTTVITGTKENAVDDVAIYYSENGPDYYYAGNNGVYNSKNENIFTDPQILDIYIYDDILLIGSLDGYVYKYDLKNQTQMDSKYTLGDQVNKIIYSKNDNMIFVACEKNGIYCIDAQTGEYNLASNLENKSQLVDLMIDYEGNLWIASHYIGASGVSIITKNALLELLYDDTVWSNLPALPANDRNVYALEKHGDILYICTSSGLYLYDTNEKMIKDSNYVMDFIITYIEDNIEPKLEQDLMDEANKETDPEKRAKMIQDIPAELEKAKKTYHDCRDIEEYNGKLYFAFNKIGLVEYNVSSNSVVIYDASYIQNHYNGAYNNPSLKVTNTIRCLRAFDDYIAMGYSKGIMRFDGTNFDINFVGSNVLFIDKSNEGKIIFDRTNGLYTISDDFSQVTRIIESVGGNSLKFLVDGDKLYYTLNSRLICVSISDGYKLDHEIDVPYVKGSLVELSKVKVKNNNNEEVYKYVVASQTQVYIVDSLDSELLVDYELYDSSNGIQPIIANSSGYYSEEEQKYYFQSTNGVYVYDFKSSQDVLVPTKICLNSIDLDGVKYYGDNFIVDKNTYRISFNLSVLSFRPDKGYSIYYKLDRVDDDYKLLSEDTNNISYTNLSGGDYKFHVYVLDVNGQKSNEIEISFTKPKHIYEQVWFWIFIISVGVALVCGINFGMIYSREKKAEEREKELKEITLESIEAIARTIDAKDTYTNGHSIRVGHYSRIIAEALGMQGDELENLYYIALLHDIGKIGIPDAILNKPGRLTDDEFAIMKSHTSKGAKILKDISTIPNIVEGAKYHHERYGGGGYPEGLKGEEIPYIARIICCADCFDAMATKRVYKDPYPKEKIISEFERCKEIQFDPNIADVVIKLIEEGKLKAELEEDLNERLNKVEEIKKANS